MTPRIIRTTRGLEALDPEPDRDPVDGRMVPCVFCMASPQVGGMGVCSPKCEEDLEEWIKEDDRNLWP